MVSISDQGIAFFICEEQDVLVTFQESEKATRGLDF